MERLILGVDEAGRGAVIGPLIMAGVVFKENDEVFEILSYAGVKDSKLLVPQKRKSLAALIRKTKYRYTTVSLLPSKIDKNSINKLGITYTTKIIDKLSPHIVYLDVPSSGSGIARYCREIRGMCQDQKVIIKGENKMDNTNLVVAAASIIAKEKREEEVHKLHKKYGDFGSGYPADPRTLAWLKERKDSLPKIVRRKWSTLERIGTSII